MVPSQSPHPHGPPLLQWLCSPGISHLHRSYSALRLPHLLPPRYGCPSLGWDSCAARIFFAGPLSPAGSPGARPSTSASEIGHRVSVPPVHSTSEIRVSQVPGSSSSHAPWSTTPPGPLLLPISVSVVVSSRFGILWTPEISTFSGLLSHGSRVRVPTLRRTRYRGRRKARYRLVWVHLAGRVSHPLDDTSEFQEVIVSFHPF
jgi:hypothetical protein